MNLVRTFAALALAAASGLAAAQAFPDRTVKIVIPYAPGGGTDNLVRTILPSLNSALGQPVVIENRPGGNTFIGTEMVVKSPPDGYTLMATDTAVLVNPGLFKSRMPFDTLKGLTGLTMMAHAPVRHPTKRWYARPRTAPPAMKAMDRRGIASLNWRSRRGRARGERRSRERSLGAARLPRRPACRPD